MLTGWKPAARPRGRVLSGNGSAKASGCAGPGSGIHRAGNRHLLQPESETSTMRVAATGTNRIGIRCAGAC